MEMNQWICTDPDMLQYVKKSPDGIYTVAQVLFPRDQEPSFKNRFVLTEDFYIPEIPRKELENVASMYYGSLSEMQRFYGDDYEQIMAECLFETNLQNCANYISADELSEAEYISINGKVCELFEELNLSDETPH